MLAIRSARLALALLHVRGSGRGRARQPRLGLELCSAAGEDRLPRGEVCGALGELELARRGRPPRPTARSRRRQGFRPPAGRRGGPPGRRAIAPTPSAARSAPRRSSRTRPRSRRARHTARRFDAPPTLSRSNVAARRRSSCSATPSRCLTFAGFGSFGAFSGFPGLGGFSAFGSGSPPAVCFRCRFRSRSRTSRRTRRTTTTAPTASILCWRVLSQPDMNTRLEIVMDPIIAASVATIALV